MKFMVSFKVDNDAFIEHGLTDETSHILRDIARRVESAQYEGNVRDSNGNTIGTWTFTEDQP